MEYIIKTENLTKKYGDTTVVKGINIHVPRGKIYGLLGRNGAGKTTLMQMILRLVRPTNGDIRLFGLDYNSDAKNIYSKIGSIIETPGFYENLTAYENLEIFRRLRGQGNTVDVQKALEIVGLDKEPSKLFSQYSLGMKQRLGIAAAIMHEPQLLILDEPINGLDPIGISEIRSFLTNLCHEKGISIFISSHVLSEIEQIADVIGVMHKGNLIEEVDMAELKKRNFKYTRIDVSDVIVASSILENHFMLTDYLIEGNTMKIFDDSKKSSEINKAFVENGISVSKINVEEGSLEEYFSGLIGGGGIA